MAAGRRLPFGNVPGDFFSATMEYTGKFLYLMRLKNEKFGRGLSGGPVLDLINGEVSGVAKLAAPSRTGMRSPSTSPTTCPAMSQAVCSGPTTVTTITNGIGSGPAERSGT